MASNRANNRVAGETGHHFKYASDVAAHLMLPHGWNDSAGAGTPYAAARYLPASELLAIHRELHLLEGLATAQDEAARESEIPWYFRAWRR